MNKELFDEDKYPTQYALLKVAKYNTVEDIDGFLDLIRTLWSYKDRFVLKQASLYLSTGGWSGNEAVIEAMRQNFFFFIAHEKWNRGGHYWFDLSGYRKSK